MISSELGSTVQVKKEVTSRHSPCYGRTVLHRARSYSTDDSVFMESECCQCKICVIMPIMNQESIFLSRPGRDFKLELKLIET